MVSKVYHISTEYELPIAWIYCNRNRVIWNIMQYATSSFMKKPKESLELMVERCCVWAWLSDMMILRNFVYRLSLLESVSRVENKLCEEENKLLGYLTKLSKKCHHPEEPKSISWLQSWWSRCPCVGNNYQNNYRVRSKVHNAQKVVLDSVELYIYI